MKTKLYMLEETSEFMMSFVIVTEKNNAVVIDGGKKEDIPLLKKYVDGRHISAWILTHAHDDHIQGFVDELEKNGCADLDIEKVYYNFPDYDALIKKTDVADYEYFCRELNEMLPIFNANKHKIADKLQVVSQGDIVQIDEVKIEFLYTFHDGLYDNLMNDASLVFKLSTPRKSVLFLGDLGPQGGDELYRESRDKLQVDIVQMAHHGHMNVGMEVYAATGARVCLWCCRDWLYNEKEIPDWMHGWTEQVLSRNRMYGTAVTRKWMEILGAHTHYVTANGTQEIEL